MKKLFFTIILILLLILPINISAGTINNHSIDIDVSSDGSMLVREYFSLDGEYNGVYRDLNYLGSTKEFTNDKHSFEGSKIYNGSQITNIRVYDVVNDSKTLNKEFTLMPTANKGDYGVYTLQETNEGVHLKIFNPHFKQTDFYLEYQIEDVVVIHEDVAEIGWDFFGTNYEEATKNLVITFNLPANNTSLKAWVHGPLNGHIELINKQKVIVTYDYLSKNTPIDTRLVFDKNIIPHGQKYSHVKALPHILAIEKERANQANRERQKVKIINYSVTGLTITWLLGLFILLFRIYYKYDRERPKEFMHQYYRDFPADYGPDVLERLMSKRSSPKGLSASILELIRKKVLLLEKTKEDVKLIVNPDYHDQLTKSEAFLKEWLLVTIGDGKEVTLKKIKQASKQAHSFNQKYQSWQDLVNNAAQQENFFEDYTSVKTKMVLYIMFGLITLVFLNLNFYINPAWIFSIIMIGVLSLMYITTFTKRTEKGHDHYYKWQAFKRFLLHFGRLDEKELPDIMLWEKYLVYATVLGVATKLEKAMRIKLQTQDISPAVLSNYTFLHLSHELTTTSIINNINHTISSVVRSSATSESGFGGGASAGGGGFGGGGGGGRF
ncbi:MAG: DUF2207 family protein [Bacilli bacterium]|jgi:uncharacterized membrane protein